LFLNQEITGRLKTKNRHRHKNQKNRAIMETKNKSLADIKAEISRQRNLLDQIHAARQAVRGYNAVPVEQRGTVAEPLRAMLAAAPAKRTFNLLAQGDSWFDYPPGTDLIDCLHSNHGHTITNIAVAGSTLNDEAYGPVPREMFGLPFGPKQSDDPDRITELVHRIQQDKPQALLLSAGGNDIAGDEFFSFINNARSGLDNTNKDVLKCVVNDTFKTAYQYLIDTALEAAKDAGITLPIFTHDYDYPWPDGRGVFSFLGWKVGPWFDPTFNQKNYPNNNAADLQVRHDITQEFIDYLNAMLEDLESQPKYAGKLFHVDLTGTLRSPADWANELHPGNAGFSALADEIDAKLQAKI
jgi:lysophospholipase L1-like esterase